MSTTSQREVAAECFGPSDDHVGRGWGTRTPMKGRRLVWLCGGFAPGRDGVGDYVRTVMRGLRETGAGAEQKVVALRDSDVGDPIEDASSLRLPVNWFVEQTVTATAAFLERFRPDTLVWNFVPQIFAPRGILRESLIRAYADLRGTARNIVFMHELWCGTGREDTVRNWISGAVQRRGVLRWLELHRPDHVLTSNAAYAAVLKHHGVDAIVVPLCSNIPRRGGVNRGRWPEALAGEPFARDDRGRWVVAGVFGAIHPVWEPRRALADLAVHARATNRKLAVVWFGRGSPAAAAAWTRLAGALESDACFVRLGPLDDAAASELLESCDLGLPTIQFNLLGKSGTATAFLEHGVPLLVVSDAWSPRFSGFARAAAEEAIALWNDDAAIDWEKLLASRPRPGSRFAACLDGWRFALTRADESAIATPAN